MASTFRFTISIAGRSFWQCTPCDRTTAGVAPGPIWTPLIPASFDETSVELFGEKTPMGRAGQPDEVATSYVFLASEDGSYFSGQVLHPNGKSTCHLWINESASSAQSASFEIHELCCIFSLILEVLLWLVLLQVERPWMLRRFWSLYLSIAVWLPRWRRQEVLRCISANTVWKIHLYFVQFDW